MQTYYTHKSSRVGSSGVGPFGCMLFDNWVDLNPHQIETAIFALSSHLSTRYCSPMRLVFTRRTKQASCRTNIGGTAVGTRWLSAKRCSISNERWEVPDKFNCHSLFRMQDTRRITQKEEWFPVSRNREDSPVVMQGLLPWRGGDGDGRQHDNC